MDTVWASSLTDRQVRSVTTVSGWEHLATAHASGRGAVVAMCHHGSWDMAVTAGLARGLRFATVMAPFGPPWMTQVAAWDRRRRGLELFSLDRAALSFVRCLRGGRLVGVMVDIPEAGPAVGVTFCRGPVAFSSVAAWLAIRTGAPIIPVECRRAGPIHEVTVHPPMRAMEGEGEAALTQRLAQILEHAIARHPMQWYPFHEVYTDGR
jgi:KDO2-lipid IV(A) lauroyltransferase